jgi:hypothetical protein
VDPQFGHTVTRITPNGLNIQYSSITAFSATGQYIMTNTTAGAVNIYDQTGSVAYAAVSGLNINTSAWDATDDERVWFTSGGLLRRHQLSTATATTAADYTASSGDRPAMSSISNGGTGDITDDNWWAFSNGTATTCAVNLTGLTTANQESQTFCVSLSGLGITDIDFTQITQVDSETGKRYVVLVSAPTGHVFSVSAPGLVYEYPLPTGSRDIPVQPHSDVGQDAAGGQIFFWHWDTPEDNKYYLAAAQLNKGADMTRPVEEGGGMRVLYTSNTTSFFTDAHFGCTWRGLCIISIYGGNDQTARFVSSVTPATPCQITTHTAHGLTTGNTVQIGGASGITSINGIWTATVTGSTTLTLDGHTCSGSYTADSGHLARAVSPTQLPNRQEIVVSRAGEEVRRIAIHRSMGYEGGDLSGYFSSPRASLSRDARYVAWASNFGVPEHPSVWIADTGADLGSTRIKSSVTPADTAAILHYALPDGEGAATVIVSTSPSLTSPVINASDSGSASVRQYVATGLAVGITYYYRLSTSKYSTSGSFQTLPVLSGSSLLRVVAGGGGTVQYGPTTSLGSSSASPLVVVVPKGVYYYQTDGDVVATVVR